ncbi:MAG TPA: peptidylprolyl isomerase [Dokdonella sp.]|uniref:peptidylprolyl isomerase n=1 Tax=Dokdonella sp. TaxID=2291710 RepID=UPI002D7FC21F|nr:peptidylprolyl isomerase [Dokdonella sp.]HET9031551.1 peptidylprolyl isomerase [Dokdonella sp.]
MNKLLVSLILVFILGAPIAHAQLMPTEKLDGIVAVIDNNVILQSELDLQVGMVVAQYANKPEQLPPRNELERQVLERMIMSKLQIARADDTGIKISDAEVDQTLGQIAKQNRMQLDQLRQAIQSQGMSWEQFRDNVRDESLIQKLRQRVIQSQVQVSDTEIDLLLKSGGVKRGQLHLGHIQITLPEGANADQIAAAEAKANEVSAQLRNGMDFAAAAIRYSDAQNALDGGDLGWRGYDELPSAFAEIADKLQPGEVAPPVRGPNGFHIIKLIERREPTSDVVTEYHARHIMIRPTEIVSAAQAEKEIKDLRAEIVAGADFAKVAKANSDDTATANLGGDMGWFVLGGYGDKVAEVLGKLKVGEISQPFLSDAGWHILELLDTRIEDKTEEAERNKARQTIGSRKADEEYASFLRQLRAEAYIEIRLPGAESATGKGS